MNNDDTEFSRFDHMCAMDMGSPMLQYASVMKTLAGKRILVTRARDQAGPVCRDISQRGGIPILLPCLAVRCLPENIRHGLVLLKRNHPHVLFTSANGVRCVSEVLQGKLSRVLARTTVAAVGDKTATALREAGLNDILVPASASQAGLLQAWLATQVPRTLVFFRAEEGSDLLAGGLRKHGCTVHTIHAYRTICPAGDTDDTRRLLAAGDVDAVLLGSARTARHYVQRIGDVRLANRPVVAVISRQAATCAQSLGLDVQVIAKQASFSSMLDELADYFRLHSNQQGDNP